MTRPNGMALTMCVAIANGILNDTRASAKTADPF